MGTSLTLALREDCTGLIFYRHRHLFFRFLSPRANKCLLFFGGGEPAPCPNILFVYRIVLFYPQHLPQLKKVPGERPPGAISVLISMF